MSNSSQKQFDLLYVTSPELAKELKVSRAAMCQAVARAYFQIQFESTMARLRFFFEVRLNRLLKHGKSC